MSGPITVTLSYHVRRGRASQFSVSATALLGTAAGQRGYLGAGVTGTASTGRDWQIFYRFEDEISLAAWEQSSAYARWIDYVEKFATRADVQHTVGEELSSVDRAPARQDAPARQEQRVMAPAGRAPSWHEAAPPEDAPVNVPVNAAPVADAPRLRQPAQQRSGRHGRPEPAAPPEVVPVDATQVMDPRLRQVAQQQSGQFERPQEPDTAPVNATQVMDAARLRGLAHQQSGQSERPQETA